jgi:hypothetical protein
MESFGGDIEGKRPLGRPKCDGTIILEWILGRRDETPLTGFI